MTYEETLFETWFQLERRKHWESLYPNEPFGQGWGIGLRENMRAGWMGRANLAPEWQAIATAPKNGRWILVWWESVTDVPFCAYWDVRNQVWEEPFTGQDYGDQSGPTHWRPLPEPPK